MFKKQLLDQIPDTRPSPALLKMKPRQVHEFPKWSQAIHKHLADTEKDFTTIAASVKADGFSVIFECHPDNTFRIYSRTDTQKPLLDGDDATRFVTSLACELRVRLACELRALYDGQELGFLEVLSMLRVFRTNGMRNVGKFQLQLCPFGVHSVNPYGSPATERAGHFLPHKVVNDLLGACIAPGSSSLVSPVQHVLYRARLYDAPGGKHELEFLTNDRQQTVARSPQAFFDYLIAEADSRGIEGFVLKADPAIFAKQAVVITPFGVRDQSAVKVKREFKVTLLACRVLESSKRGKKSLIFTYGLNDKGELVYAGEQSGHQRLNDLLGPDTHAFKFEDKEGKAALYALTKEQFQRKIGSFVMTTSSCTNMSKNRFCPIGLKLHDMTSKPVDLRQLSVLKNVAEANPHFRSTRDASNRFAEATQRGQKRLQPGQADEPQKRACPAAPAPVLLSWEDAMDQMGVPFQPPAPVQREPSPVSSPGMDERESSPLSPLAQETQDVVVVIDDDQAPEVRFNQPHTVFFTFPVGPMQTDLYKKQFAQLGWTRVFTPDAGVTLLVVANQDVFALSYCKAFQKQCPNAQLVTRETLQAHMPSVRRD